MSVDKPQPPAVPRSRTEPLVFSLTDALGADTVARLADRIGSVSPSQAIVVDVTGVPSFDSDGTSALFALQERLGHGRLSIVGLREAAARLLGNAEVAVETTVADAAGTDIRLRRMPNLVVVTCTAAPTADQLQRALETAIDADLAIVVVDLEPLTTLGADLLDVLAFASSRAAMRGQELVLLNLSTEASSALRSTSLAATTYLAAAT
jgi:anti-anti-sigma regulatory factor